jgi:hypothetical protein
LGEIEALCSIISQLGYFANSSLFDNPTSRKGGEKWGTPLFSYFQAASNVNKKGKKSDGI